MPQQLSNLEQALTQRQTPTIGPQDTGVLSTVRNLLNDFQTSVQQQPVVKVLQSPFGQVLMGAGGEGDMAMAPKINLLADHPMPVGMVMKRAFNNALDDYYSVPLGAPKSVRAPKATAVDNIYNQLSALNLAADQANLDKLNAAVQERKNIALKAKNYPQTTIDASAGPAQTILAHITNNGYTPQPNDFTSLNQAIKAVNDTGAPITGLGDLVRRLSGYLPRNSPLKQAVRGASNWSQFDEPTTLPPGTWVGKAGSANSK